MLYNNESEITTETNIIDQPVVSDPDDEPEREQPRDIPQPTQEPDPIEDDQPIIEHDPEPDVDPVRTDARGDLQYDKPIGPPLPVAKDVVDAWYDGMPHPPVKRRYGRNVSVGKAILEAGYTCDQVTRLTQSKYRQGRTTQVKLEYIEADLPQWVAAGEPDHDHDQTTRSSRPTAQRNGGTHAPSSAHRRPTETDEERRARIKLVQERSARLRRERELHTTG